MNNGNIRMKKSAKKEGLIGVNEKALGTGVGCKNT